MAYNVDIDKNEKMEIVITSDDSVAINIWGGTNYKKNHGSTHLSYEGVCNLIAALEAVKNDMENDNTDMF